MFIRTEYTNCGSADYHNVKLHVLEHTVFDDLTQACMYTVEHIEVADTINEEDMATLIMRELRSQVKNAVEISGMCKIIKEYFGVTANYCCDIIQRIELEEGMYSPDRVHLYYA